MSEQIIIRVKVDRELKEQATDILDQIGISIPVAVRMFLKATVREKGLPILTKAAWKPSDEEQQVEYIRNRLLYQAPLHSDSETVALLPLERGKRIPAAMYVQLVTKVPEGKLTCWEDLFAFLEKLYNVANVDFPERSLPLSSVDGDIPYWRIVSKYGVLEDGRGGSRETQKEFLIKEHIPVVQRGNMLGSYRVKDYKKFMFDYEKLRVVSTL